MPFGHELPRSFVAIATDIPKMAFLLERHYYGGRVEPLNLKACRIGRYFPVYKPHMIEECRKRISQCTNSVVEYKKGISQCTNSAV